jgi:hypothetical protein
MFRRRERRAEESLRPRANPWPSHRRRPQAHAPVAVYKRSNRANRCNDQACGERSEILRITRPGDQPTSTRSSAAAASLVVARSHRARAKEATLLLALMSARVIMKSLAIRATSPFWLRASDSFEGSVPCEVGSNQAGLKTDLGPCLSFHRFPATIASGLHGYRPAARSSSDILGRFVWRARRAIAS